MEFVLLSIIVPVYNQQNYVVEALDSIFYQKLDFPFEVLVGDDCSTDSSASILREYEKSHSYPQLRVFYRDHNMSNDVHGNAWDLKNRSRGKYITVLEGDDFWIDPFKLQKQINFLECHDDYIAVAHNCIVVGENSKPNGEMYQECKDEKYTFEHFASEILPGQTATLVLRNIYKNNIIDLQLVNLKLRPGDRKLAFALLLNGKIHCIQEPMSAYRHIVKGGASYSANAKYNFSNELRMVTAYCEYANLTYSRKGILTAEILYTLTLRDGIRKGEISIWKAGKLFCNVQNKWRVLFDLMMRDMNRHIFKRSLCVRHL